MSDELFKIAPRPWKRLREADEYGDRVVIADANGNEVLVDRPHENLAVGIHRPGSRFGAETEEFLDAIVECVNQCDPLVARVRADYDTDYPEHWPLDAVEAMRTFRAAVERAAIKPHRLHPINPIGRCALCGAVGDAITPAGHQPECPLYKPTETSTT